MKLYSYNKCGTCRKAKKFLDASGVSCDEIDITETPPPRTVLRQAIKVKGIKKLFNTSGFTTAKVALQFGRGPLGFEINKKAYEYFQPRFYEKRIQGSIPIITV